MIVLQFISKFIYCNLPCGINSTRCEPESMFCDGTPECPNGEDEKCDLAQLRCNSKEIQCGDGSCLPNEMRCDGESDCADGADEAGCDKQEEDSGRECSSALDCSQLCSNGTCSCVSG
eukprot:sb/3476430/